MCTCFFLCGDADVAVKILTEAGAPTARATGGGGGSGGGLVEQHSSAQWDKVQLEKLLHEVGAFWSLKFG